MRIMAVTPIVVGAAELERRQARYDRLCPDGVEVVLHDLEDPATAGPGGEVAPRALDTAEQIAASERLVAAQLARVDVTAYDALLPDCVLDPVVGTEVERTLPLPLHGLTRLAAHHLAGTGARLVGVARNGPIAAELDRKLASYGVTTTRATAVLDLDFDAIADDAVWAAALDRTVADLPADAVLNACSAVEVGTREGGGPVVVDPTRTALRVLGLSAAATGAVA